MSVDEHTITLDAETPVFFRQAPAASPPPLYVHGIPTSGDDWLPLLERRGGIAPDLIGFGRSGKGGQLDYTPPGLAGFLNRLLEELRVGEVSLVAHGWGALATLRFALSDPPRVSRLALISPPPALPGFAPTLLERAWRVRGLGELVMGSTTKWLLGRSLRRATTTGAAAWPASQVDLLWRHFDQGTQRAILRLHRAWGAEQAQALETALAQLPMPALVLWGDSDPWCPPKLAQAYAARLPQARAESIAQAGHWPWLDRPAAVDVVAAWLDG